MSYKLHREVREGKVTGLSLGVPEADAYLRFLKDRCRPSTWISYGYDLQVFLNAIQKPVSAVTPADILAFIESQREVSRPRRTAAIGRQADLHGLQALQPDNQAPTIGNLGLLRISQGV